MILNSKYYTKIKTLGKLNLENFIEKNNILNIFKNLLTIECL